MLSDPASLSSYPYSSTRTAVLATGAMVATSQPLAAQAGLGVLADGGNAVDAAVAAAAALTVVEPCSNGLGSDAFALVWDGNELHGLNGSGRWPAKATAERLREQAHTERLREQAHPEMPPFGWDSVTVPGAIDAWSMLHERFGSIELERVLRPALNYAENGFAVSPVVGEQWAQATGLYLGLGLKEVAEWANVFAPGGQCPQVGTRWASPSHAHTLRTLSERGLRDFYDGSIAQAISDYAAETGGLLSPVDLAGHVGQWVTPISGRFRDYDIWEIPPNGQGIAALMALGLVSHTPVADHPNVDAASWHYRIEAMKLAFADSDATVADPEHSEVPVQALLSPEYLAERATLIGDTAGPAPQGDPVRGGTVYLCTADADGMMVSFIQSNYMGFGSGVVVPGHGIALQNRAAGFVLDPDHPNVAAPGKRPRHTIIPGFVTKDGRAVGPFGVMGGEMQPQGHLQVLSGLIDHQLNPQAALDAPRWRVERDGTVKVEAATPTEVVNGLKARGHTVVESDRMLFGRGQIIVRDDHGVLAGGTEPRADGSVLGF